MTSSSNRQRASNGGMRKQPNLVLTRLPAIGRSYPPRTLIRPPLQAIGYATDKRRSANGMTLPWHDA
jgi:hypothetical protein